MIEEYHSEHPIEDALRTVFMLICVVLLWPLMVIAYVATELQEEKEEKEARAATKRRSAPCGTGHVDRCKRSTSRITSLSLICGVRQRPTRTQRGGRHGNNMHTLRG